MPNEKKQEENGKNNKNILTGIKDYFTGGAFANGLAIILILGTIGAIIWIIGVHQATVSYNQQLYKEIINKPNPDVNISDQIFDSFQIFYRESNAANTNILSILLPVFGAWVGAIIAFYYGNKNFEKLSQGYKDAVDAISTSIDDSRKLAVSKVEDVLEKYPEYKEVLQAKISDLVGKSFKEIGTTFLLKDDADKPLGFMYMEDILKLDITEENLKKETKSFKEFIIERSIIDEITSKKWTENGLEDKYKNYIEISLNDTLLTARDKMKVLTDKQKVRCLVLDNQRQIKGIITMELIAKASTDEIEEKVIK